MTYTFWHSGVLIGESDLEEGSLHPRQRGGVFRATAYGLAIFPRLSGILSAGHALKTHLETQGLSPDHMDENEIDELLDATPVGQRIIDIGRMLADVEVRGPDGRRLEFASIAFTDVLEVKRLARELAVDGANDLPDLPPDAPRHIVSATFREPMPATRRAGHAGRLPRRPRWTDS